MRLVLQNKWIPPPKEFSMGQISETDRYFIQNGLDRRETIVEIARKVGKDRTTVSREVFKHRSIFNGAEEFAPKCNRLVRPPYVCNGCEKIGVCREPKCLYRAAHAEEEHRRLLSTSRQGMNMTAEEMKYIGALLRDGLARGMSVHHVMASHPDKFNVCQKTVYNLINSGCGGVKRHDLLAAPNRRARPRKSKPRQHKVDRACLEGRRPEDFEAFMASHPGCNVVEMDTVEGKKGGKVLLTLNFNCCGLMLAFLRDRNTAETVNGIFDMLESLLGPGVFRRMFPVIKTDNGSEFSDPSHIERSLDGGKRTSVFYCHPLASQEKPHVENNHENMRRIFPKGVSLDSLTQEDVAKGMSNVNSMLRKGYGDVTAIARFEAIFGKKILPLLGIRLVEPDKVILKPELVGLKQ